MRYPSTRAAAMLVAVATGCSGSHGGRPDLAVVQRDSSPPADRGPDTAARRDAAPPAVVDTGALFLDGCSKLPKRCTGTRDPNCGKCEYRIRHKASCTRARPCDNLFLLWTAGNCRGAPFQANADRLLDANPDFIVACVAPQITGQTLPVSLGAPERENLLIPHVLDRLRKASDLGVWSGKNLLHGGCSAGGSRYPVVAARYPDDATWVGSARTAACFGDGVVSISYQDAFIGEKIGVGRSCAWRHQRVIDAYTRAPASGHACRSSPGGQCPCDPGHVFRKYPGDCGGGDCVAFDSIVVRKGSGFALAAGVTAGAFAVRHWKLISEGSGWEGTSQRCEADVTPMGPYRALCTAIDADPARDCTFVSRPNDRHCTSFWRDLNKTCVAWFRRL